MGFQTGQAMTSIGERLGSDSITIFIPSSPTPFTGYTITVPKDSTIDLPLTVEEAIGFTISGGVLRPPSQGGPQPVIELPNTPRTDPEAKNTEEKDQHHADIDHNPPR